MAPTLEEAIGLKEHGGTGKQVLQIFIKNLKMRINRWEYY